MDGLTFPTWKSVLVPSDLVHQIKTNVHGKLLESLVADKVMHQIRRVQYAYTCRTCSHVYKPDRYTEDCSQCQHCKSLMVSLSRTVKFGRQAQVRQQPRGDRDQYRVPAMAVMEDDAQQAALLRQMQSNYEGYFYGHEPRASDMLTVKWNGQGFIMSFLGGDQLIADSIQEGIKKAAVLCPFLWDGRFDWKKNCFRSEIGRETMLCTTLMEWVNNRV